MYRKCLRSPVNSLKNDLNIYIIIMKKNNEILGGFSALFEEMGTNEPAKEIKGVEIIADPNDPDSRDTEPIDMDEEDDVDPLIPDIVDEDEIDEEKELNDDDTKEAVEVDQDEADQVTAFFDIIADKVGWGSIDDEEKPKSVDDLVEYMKSAIEESSKPEYASEDVAAIDEFVRNGGNLQDYFSTVSTEVDYSNIDLDKVENQKLVVSEFMKEKGFTDSQIKRKIEKYEDADILEDEANDAIESLIEIKEEKRKELLERQKIEAETAMQEQQKFYKNVVGEIEGLSDIRGIKIPKEDKKQLMEYIFKVESDGKTRYQKDYAKSTKNLIESAYFTMKGDKLLESAKKSGETSSTDKFRRALVSNKVGGTKQKIDNGSPTPLWTMASKHLLNRPK